jgi:GDP-mannose transporter
MTNPPAMAPLPPSTSAVSLAILQFAIASVVMVAGNKAAVQYLPYPCTLVIIQAIGTLALLWVFYSSQITRLTRATVLQWLPISVLFSAMLFTSMKSMVYSSVSTILVLRNVGPIFTTIAELLMGKLTVTPSIILAEALIVAGAVLYTGGAFDYSPEGLMWILLNVAAQVAYGVTLKHKMDTSPQLKEMTKFSMSLYNNLLCLPLIVFVLWLQDEHKRIMQRGIDVSPFGWFVVALTCVFGFVISTSGFAVQKLVSATTFLVINNVTKFANIFFGIVFMGDKVDDPKAIAGCIIALGAGAFYSWEQMHLAERAKKEAVLREALAAATTTASKSPAGNAARTSS